MYITMGVGVPHWIGAPKCLGSLLAFGPRTIFGTALWGIPVFWDFSNACHFFFGHFGVHTASFAKLFATIMLRRCAIGGVPVHSGDHILWESRGFTVSHGLMAGTVQADALALVGPELGGGIADLIGTSALEIGEGAIIGVLLR